MGEVVVMGGYCWLAGGESGCDRSSRARLKSVFHGPDNVAGTTFQVLVKRAPGLFRIVLQEGFDDGQMLFGFLFDEVEVRAGLIV